MRCFALRYSFIVSNYAIIGIFCLFFASETYSQTSFWGETDKWNGYTRHVFQLEGRECYVVLPHKAAKAKPWIWRARFWGHEPQLDLALLQQGFHVVYMDVAGLYGNEEAVRHWNSFYKYLTVEHAFGKKVVIEAMSRGGLIAYNWASENPEKVACIYADAPVCDIKSWPGGLGQGKGSKKDWEQCLNAYGLDEEEVGDFRANPIDVLGPLAEAGVPLLHVCGADDEVVPMAENTDILADRYRKLGGSIQVISKPNNGHHPHSLPQPIPILHFIYQQFPELKYEPEDNVYFSLPNKLTNSLQVFTSQKKGKIAFLGGSITHNPGWRDKLAIYLNQSFPTVELEFINAGIPSLGSTPNAFRMEEDVLSKGKIDLLFVEAAVNDATNGRSALEQIRAMEGLVRHARTANPYCDIVFMYFVDPDKIESYNRGFMPEVIVQHQKVADHYRIPSLNLALEVTEHLNAGKFSWEKDFVDLHPSPFGQEFYYQSMKKMLDSAWSMPSTTKKMQKFKLPEPLDPFNYESGYRVRPEKQLEGTGWEYVESWKPDTEINTRKGFVNVPMLEATGVDAALKYEFEGKAIGIWVIAGPDVGMLEYQVDDGPKKQLDQFTRWSSFLHLPWVYMLETELSKGRHTLSLRTLKSKNPNSKGNACRIVYFVGNGGR